MSACLFVLFLGNFFHRCWHFVKHNSYFPSPKIWKNLITLPEMRNVIPVSYQILSLGFLPGVHLRDLQIKARRSWIGWLNKGTRHLETDQKNNKLVCINLSRLVMHCGQLINFKMKWKGKRDPQTCYWIRASRPWNSSKARDVCSLSSPWHSLLRNVWSHIVLFFCQRGREGQRAQPPKASTMCSLFSILQKTDPNLSLTNFWGMFLFIAIFVCCQLDIWVNWGHWAVWNCLFARETIVTPREILMCRFVRFLNEHFRTIYRAFDCM